MKLRVLRHMKELTQSDLAKLIGVTAHAISQYELNQRTPKLKTMYKLADALEVDLQVIVNCFVKNEKE